MPINGADAAGPGAGASASFPLPPATPLVVSESLEATHPLPVRDGRVVGGEFDARVVEVMVDDLVAERLSGDRRVGEQGCGVAQRRGNPRHVALVRVALEQVGQLQLVVDAVETGGDE